MSILSKILFPSAVVSLALAGTLMHTSPVQRSFVVPEVSVDTVIYHNDGFKRFRRGVMEDIALSDSLLAALGSYGTAEELEDTVHRLSARDTIFAPDSLRLIDPFRYKYYVALLDSLTHVQVRDSLRESERSLKAAGDTLSARIDSMTWRKLDSLYARDSVIRVKEAFERWYNGLSKEERKKYDYEQKIKRKLHETDSLKAVKEEKQAVRDSIRENTPRILETFALPDSLYYKRILSWNIDPDVQRLSVHVPDTSYNHYFYDFAFRRKDVQSSWLGVAGSPVQPYNYFERTGTSGLDWYTPYESWTFTHRTIPMYNTKTPYTELAYWGTLLANDDKASDNIHIFTTQNILPELNLSLLYDRWGGGGMLDNESTANKTFFLAGNYIGKKYMMHTGFISNTVMHEENGGIIDPYWIRDTSVDARDINVNLTKASSETKRKTVFLDQQYRIPFTFIEKLRHRGDSTFTMAADTMIRDVTTAFIGHSSEYSTYSRTYADVLDARGRAFYNNVANYSNTASADTIRMAELDNKVFVRLQPWSEHAFVSKIDVGIGDRIRTFADSAGTMIKTRQNSLYAYAGAEGRLMDFFSWDAKGQLAFGGYNAGDLNLEANAFLTFYPFRRARRSPLSLSGHFETSLTEPDHYQQSLWLNHFNWDNDFAKSSVSKIRGRLDIPHWGLRADVGYALLSNNLYYDTLGVIRQNADPMSVISATLRKDFAFGPVHLENSVLLQFSSDQEVLPLPTAAANLRWYLQFVLQRDEARNNVLTVQIGANAFYNTAWYAPAWNPELGVFHNQNESRYTNGPVIDAFVNMQWKRACIFIKMENVGMGWPMDRADYFTAHNYIGTQRAIKFGLFWPFYVQPGKNKPGTSDGTAAGGAGARSGAGGPRGRNTAGTRQLSR